MNTSSQTTADLKSIVETLDQRIHELATQSDPASLDVDTEALHLVDLRDQASALL